jgi:hypothetical protein
VWGTYYSVLVFQDIFGIYVHPPSATPEDLIAGDALTGEKILVHQYTGKEVPLWLAVVYLGSNLTLNGLNYYWFSRMVQTVTARFKAPKKKVTEDEKVWVEGTDVDLATAAEIVGMQAEEVRRRYTGLKN